ncbi:hypothetical protein B0H19DRAFT_1175740 [Mycena capillaripes]|nr:hypothetical protein B0H19DRAFT_1175740 [Mycena capillaripes]
MASSPLLSVPTELSLAVVETIDDTASLRSFAVTCKLARLLAEPVLYRAVLVRTGSQASCLVKALQQQQPPTRAELVRALDLRPKYDRDADADVEALMPLVGAMTQLRALSMESPFANYGHWLSSAMTIHWSGDGSRFWLLTEFKQILTLPALQSLTVSCAVLSDDIADGLAALAGTTPLTHLELVECIVSQKALTAVLALPRALRSFYLSIMRYYSPPSDTYDYKEASPEQQLEALHQQRHSLQQLTWVDKDFADDTDVRRVSTVPGSGLYDFTELHTLTLDGGSALLFSTLSECAPPNLDRLRIFRHDHDQGTVLDPTDSVASTHIPGIPPPFSLHQYLPKLHHLDLLFCNLDRYDTESLWAKPDRRDHVKRLGEDYHACGIRLDIFVADRGRYIPPYLFGEEAPREEPAYCAENAWFSPEMT